MSSGDPSTEISASEPEYELQEIESRTSQTQSSDLAPPAENRTLFDDVLSTDPKQISSLGRLGEFLAAKTIGDCLQSWFGTRDIPLEDIGRRLNHSVAAIDEYIQNQLNAIIHHPRFQQLESSWRGVHYLVNVAAREDSSNVKIRVFNASWKEVVRDLERAVEFDQSQLFKKIYEDEFGSPGGQPLGAIIGDYEIQPRPSTDHPTDDIGTLAGISQIAAAAFCPFITAAHPSMFGLNQFSDLEQVENLESGFGQAEFIKWRSFRDSDDSRFVGLALPRVLMRRPHETTALNDRGFCFTEDVAGVDRNKYLWGNAAYAYGETLIRAYAQSGWLAETRGVTRDMETGGLVTGLPIHYFGTDREPIAPKSSTEIVITETQEAMLSHEGFLPLVHCPDTEFCAFYSSQSVQKPKVYDRAIATQNARISSMLHYMLCVSRFAHYLKVIARDKVGSFATPEQCTKELRTWVANYVTPDEKASVETKARRPLREADIEIVRDPGKPGSFLCTLRLSPHYQFDGVHASVMLRTKISAQAQKGT
jgi:type VI secretion system ImpC/EvpB family protein